MRGAPSKWRWFGSVCTVGNVLPTLQVLSMFVRSLVIVAAFLLAGSAHALTPAEARAMAAGDSDARIEALNKAVAAADDRTAAFIQALIDDAVKVAGDQVLVVRDGKALDPVTGTAAALPADA